MTFLLQTCVLHTFVLPFSFRTFLLKLIRSSGIRQIILSAILQAEGHLVLCFFLRVSQGFLHLFSFQTLTVYSNDAPSEMNRTYRTAGNHVSQLSTYLAKEGMGACELFEAPLNHIPHHHTSPYITVQSYTNCIKIAPHTVIILPWREVEKAHWAQPQHPYQQSVPRRASKRRSLGGCDSRELCSGLC